MLAMRNNHNPNESLRMEIMELLLEAYSALSCIYIPEHAISDAFLPGLRCLLEDVRQIAPCHEPAVAAMIADFEAKLDSTRERTPSLSSPMASMEEMKRKMTKIFAVPPANARSNLPNIFQLRKKWTQARLVKAPRSAQPGSPAVVRLGRCQEPASSHGHKKDFSCVIPCSALLTVYGTGHMKLLAFNVCFSWQPLY